jgi:hypothetical protein
VIAIEILLGCVVPVLFGGMVGAAQSGNTDGFIKILTAYILALGFIGLLLK